jgi:hypothetical protein
LHTKIAIQWLTRQPFRRPPTAALN